MLGEWVHTPVHDTQIRLRLLAAREMGDANATTRNDDDEIEVYLVALLLLAPFTTISDKHSLKCVRMPQRKHTRSHDTYHSCENLGLCIRFKCTETVWSVSRRECVGNDNARSALASTMHNQNTYPRINTTND